MRRSELHQRLLVTCLVASVGLAGNINAQFGTQLVLDTATTSGYAFSGTTANNGDAVFLCKGHDGFSSIRRHAPDGTPIWSKDYATGGVNSQLKLLQADPNGGFLVARQRSTTIIIGSAGVPDTTVLEIDFASIGEDGEVGWARILRLQRVGYFQFQANIHWIRALRLSNNEIALFVGIDLSGSNGFLALLKLSEDGGQLIQAKQFGYNSPQDPWLTLGHDGSSLLDAGGGEVVFVGPRAIDPDGSPYVVRFDSEGDWLWAKTINYTNGAPGQSTHKLTIAPNGELLVHHEVSAPGGSTVLHRLAPDGTWIRSDLYSDMQWVGSESFLLPLPVGGYVIVKRTGSMLFINEDASPIALYGHPSNIYSGMQYAGSFSSALIQGNELHLYGPFSGNHLVFGNMISWPFFERFDLSGPLEGCNVVDVGVEHYEIPANLLEIVDQNPPPTVDISSTIEMMDADWTVTDLSGLSPLSLCLLIQQLGVGVEEMERTRTAPMLRSNARAAGSSVDIMVPAPGNLQLRDSFGRLVSEKRIFVDGTTQLSAPSVAGHYVLSWTASDGSGRRSERMMVY